ncbi:hypothetical protein [Paenibacillus sp. UNC499MF]|uniref:hypothetical protein n=1 Tax=Paenibacillus sp. UNC499MF TaxID=1502751 RepID=UPI00215612DB|nr:hypothetical protein [Paenibacillus sp. UNC499MF]
MVDIFWVVGSVLLLEDKGITGTMTVFGISVILLAAAVVGVFSIFEVLYCWRNRYFRRN